ELDVAGDGAPKTLVLGMAVADDEASARAKLAPYAHAIATVAGISAEARVGLPATRNPSSPTSDGPLASMGAGARLAWGLEGDLIVLRDFASHGPFANAGAYRTTAVVFALVAVALWVTLGLETRGAPAGAMIGTGAVALVVSIAAYAFFEIG